MGVNFLLDFRYCPLHIGSLASCIGKVLVVIKKSFDSFPCVCNKVTLPVISPLPDLDVCYNRFSSPVGTENRGGSEVEEILTAAHREFGGCAHRCAGKPKCREQD